MVTPLVNHLSACAALFIRPFFAMPEVIKNTFRAHNYFLIPGSMSILFYLSLVLTVHVCTNLQINLWS